MRLNKGWEFKDVDTKRLTHCFHNYPATMVPQIARKLLDEFGIKAKLLFDPYCGTGTSLVESNIKGINAIGTDLNPLARIISKSKTTIIEQQTLDLYIKDFYEYLFQYRYGFTTKGSVVVNKFQNIDYWFSKSVQTDLEIIRNFVHSINEESIKYFFEVAFSQTIRDCSWTRNDEFKLYRMSSDKMKSFKPNVFETFETILARNRLGLLDFMKEKKNNCTAHIYDFDTINPISSSIIEPNSVDIVVTSPPYGDSKTTVAYGQFSRLTCQWLGIETANQIDNILMGGKRIKDFCKFESQTLNKNINSVKKIDEGRALEVTSFYEDYSQSIRNVADVIKPNGYACFVVSNRCVKGITIETDIITRDFFKFSGFKHKNTFRRKIANKRMPRQNSPTGKTGENETLMNYESIVIMQKL
jgi:site-specific DNA-methyltransferase (cytosine-N4-specific)